MKEKKFCAFGSMTPHRTGKIVEENLEDFRIKPDNSRVTEWWSKGFVLTFETKEESEAEVKKWRKNKDPYD